MATAAELGLRQGDIVRVATPILEKVEAAGPYCGRRPSEMKFTGLDYSKGPRVMVLGADIRGDPRFGRPGSYTRVGYLEDSQDGKKAGDVAELSKEYTGFIPPVERGESATG